MSVLNWFLFGFFARSAGLFYGWWIGCNKTDKESLVRHDLTAGLVHVTGLEPPLPIAQKGAEVELRIKFNDDDKLFLTFNRYTCNVVVSPENARSLALTLNNYADEMLKSGPTIEDFLDGPYPDDELFLDNLFPDAD